MKQLNITLVFQRHMQPRSSWQVLCNGARSPCQGLQGNVTTHSAHGRALALWALQKTCLQISSTESNVVKQNSRRSYGMGVLGWTESTYQVNSSIIPVDKVSTQAGVFLAMQMKSWLHEFGGTWTGELVDAHHLFWRDLQATTYSRVGTSEELSLRRFDFVESHILLQLMALRGHGHNCSLCWQGWYTAGTKTKPSEPQLVAACHTLHCNFL